jgi:DNA polymerase I-like protein with 3'-5' exonuclease and polymerase domains
MQNQERLLTFDFETTTHNKGHPFDARNTAVSYATLETIGDESNSSFRYYLDPDFSSNLSDCVDDASVLVGFNIKFDLHWLRNLSGECDLSRVKVWDCQLAEFIYSGQEARYASLNETCEKYGLPTKINLVEEYWNQGIDTRDIPVSILEEYNRWDVQLTKMLFDVQQRLLSEKQKRLVWLEGEDLKALQAAEYDGIRFDTEKAIERLAKYKSDVENIDHSLSQFLPDGIPQGGFNYNSGDHLSALLYGGTIVFPYATETPAVYKSGEKKGQDYIQRKWHEVSVNFPQRFKPLADTEVKKTKDNPTATVRFYQVDAPTLSQLKTRDKDSRRILTLLQERAAATKVAEMIESVLNLMEKKNWTKGYIHGQFNQNVVITGRLSSSSPNLQNTPPELDELLISRY